MIKQAPQSDMDKKNIIAILGVPRSGKIEAMGYLMAAYDLPKVSFKSVLEEELVKSGLPIGYMSGHQVQEELRKTRGEGYYVNEVIKKIDANEHEHILLEGLESSADYQVLRGHYSRRLHTITIHLPMGNIVSEFFRDAKEVMRLEEGGPITVTEHLVVNEGQLGKLTDALDMIMVMHGIFKQKV